MAVIHYHLQHGNKYVLCLVEAKDEMHVVSCGILSGDDKYLPFFKSTVCVATAIQTGRPTEKKKIEWLDTVQRGYVARAAVTGEESETCLL
jgi:hypothetical protein